MLLCRSHTPILVCQQELANISLTCEGRLRILKYAIDLIKNFCPAEKQFFPSPTSSEIGAVPGNHFCPVDLRHVAAMLSPRRTKGFVFARLNSFSSNFTAKVDVQNVLFLS